jgi:hypothetical protein
MIKRLSKKDLLEIIDFINSTKDDFEELFVTINKERKFLRNNINLLKKLILTQQCFGEFNPDLKGICIIYGEKSYRPYLKFLTKNNKVCNNLLLYLLWHYSNQDLFIKLKRNNSLSREFQNKGFVFLGSRGNEILLQRKATPIRKLEPKDGIEDEEKRLY